MSLSAPMRAIVDDLLIRPRYVRPHLLLDVLIEVMSLPSDAALSRKLRVSMNAIYKHRSGERAIGSQMLMRMHEASGIPLQELRALMVETELSALAWEKSDKPRRRSSATPHRLLDAVIEKMNLESNAALARMLEVAPSVIGKWRNGKQPIGRRTLSRLQKATAIPIQELHALLTEMNLPIPTVSPKKKAVKPHRHVTPHRLLDAVIEKMHLKNDTALVKLLAVNGATISRLRHRKMPIGPSMLTRIHEKANIPIRELHVLLVEMNLPIPTVSSKEKSVKPHRHVTPHRLLDAVIEKMHLESDAALARMLEVAPTVISKRRNGKVPIGRSILSRLHKATAIPMQELHTLLAEMNLPIPAVSPKKKADKPRRRSATPHRLLDAVIEKVHLKNDTALVKLLAINGTAISNLRHRKMPISPAMLTRMHEKAAIPIRELHALLVEMNLPIPTVSPKEEPVKPHRLLDAVIEKMHLKNDSALAKLLATDRAAISKLRHRKMPIGPAMLLRMHEKADIPIRELLTLLAEMNLPIPIAHTVAPRKKVGRQRNHAHSNQAKPHRLLDAVIEKMHLKNDAALARILGVTPPTISKLRYGRIPMRASMLIRIHEATDIPMRELRALIPDDASGHDHGNAIAAANRTRESTTYAPT